MAKVYALAILAVISLVGPVLEAAVTGRVEPFSKFGLAETFLSIAPIYWWYYVDKEQRRFRAGPVLNVGVVALAIIALPVYFIRSRGWKRGSVSIVWAIGVLAGAFFFEWLWVKICKAVPALATHAPPG